MASILLVGKPHSTKTTFITQLIARIESGKSVISLYKPIEDLTSIIDASKAIAKGEEVAATSTEKNLTLTLPLHYNNENVDLSCPDYGGEQINKIIQDREVDAKWGKSIKQTNNWIFFIRPTSLSSYFDLSNKTLDSGELKNSEAPGEEYEISDQSSFIELLQFFLNVKGHDAHAIIKDIKLSIVLTCWDELDSPGNPKSVLKKNLPLLLEFIEANWAESHFQVLGLSAQGFSLKEQENRDKYLENGSENFGYLISSDGNQIDDLTELIVSATS
jgi:hypothetical protein